MSLLHPPLRRRQRRLRRAITALSVAVTVAVLASVATVVPSVFAQPAAADTAADVDDTLDPPEREGPFWQHLGQGAYMNFTITYGEDARLGPDAAGDGWYLHAAERLNVVDFFGMTPYGSSNPHVELYVVAGGGSPQPSDLRKEYDPWWCNCAVTSGVPYDPHATSWQGLDGGALWARITFTTNKYPWEHDTGFVQLSAPGCHCVLPAVRTPVQIENSSPVSSVFAPAQGAVIHRSAPEHRQEFSALFDDLEHHNITAFFEVSGPAGSPEMTTYTGTVKATPPPPHRLRHSDPGAYPFAVATPPLELPRRNGTYTFRVQARDTSGRSTAQGPWSQPTTFEYIWNLPPATPSQTVPSPGMTFPANVPVAFVAKAVDPENDNVTLRTVIDNESTYHSIPTASGREAVTVIADGIPPGPNHSSVVTGIDVNGEVGQHDTVTFAATSAVNATNQPPGAPTLVAPTSGGSFAADAPQDFVLRAVDPDNDDYRGVIEIADTTGNPVTTFATDEARSGDTVTARPLNALAAGAYQWRARAFDSKGALGPQSAWQSFSVAGSSDVVVSDDCATGTTFTQATAAGHYAHLQAAGNDVCWRIDGPAAASGGKLTVTMPGSSAPPVPTADDNTAACTTVLLNGTVGDPADPSTYLPFRIATSIGIGEASVCVDLGNEHRRVRQSFPGAIGTPTVALGFDPPGRAAAAISPSPGLPSSGCSSQNGSITHLAGTAGPAFAHVTSWQESPTRVHLCVRQQWTAGAGGPNVGGRFTVDAATGPGPALSLETAEDFAPCPVAVASLGAPVQTEVRRSSGTNPASVCLALAGSRLRVTVGAAGGTPSPPTITWTPDPGTPGI